MTWPLPTGTALGRLTIFEVYDFYDGPRLFSAMAASGAAYLAIWVSEHRDADEWLYVSVSMRRLDEIVEGVVPLRDAFLYPEDEVALLVRTPLDGTSASLASLSLDRIDQEMLPAASDRLSGRRSAWQPVESPEAAQGKTHGRVIQRLKLERRAKKPVSFSAATACLAKWQALFSHALESAGGGGDLYPLQATTGSFRLSLSVPKKKSSGMAFRNIQELVRRIELSEGGVGSKGSAIVDARELDGLVDALRDNELMLTIEQESVGTEELPPIVLDLRAEGAFPSRVHSVAARFLLTEEIPQADDLGRIIRLVDILGNHIRVTPENLDVVARQVDYYKHAGRVLRLLGDENELTAVGEQVHALQDPDARLAAIAVQFETSRCGWRWVQWSGASSLIGIDPSSAPAFLQDVAPGLAASTARRRARTLDAWCRELQRFHFLSLIQRQQS